MKKTEPDQGCYVWCFSDNGSLYVVGEGRPLQEAKRMCPGKRYKLYQLIPVNKEN